MHRGRELIGKTVVSAVTGETLGSASDLLLAESRHELIGIVVRRGWFTTERVLPYSSVQTVGPDAVIVKSADGLLDRDAWRKHGEPAIRSSRLKGKPVVTTGGRTLGEIRDVLVDDQTGTLTGYEISARNGAFARRSIVPRVNDVTVGPDAIVVPDSAVR